MTSEGPFWLLSDFSVHRSVKDIQNKQTKKPDSICISDFSLCFFFHIFLSQKSYNFLSTFFLNSLEEKIVEKQSKVVP